jgi:hypothetical protein
VRQAEEVLDRAQQREVARPSVDLDVEVPGDDWPRSLWGPVSRLVALGDVLDLVPSRHSGAGTIYNLVCDEEAQVFWQVRGFEIEDGSPGPRQEMRVTDPDGYVLMVAQIE